MALYIPDNKYIDGKKALEELSGPGGDLIRYYVAENEKHHKQMMDKFTELTDSLRIIKKFIV